MDRSVLPGSPPMYSGSLVSAAETLAEPTPGFGDCTPSTNRVTTFLFLLAEIAVIVMTTGRTTGNLGYANTSFW